MNKEEVVSHVEKVSGKTRDQFETAKQSLKIFSDLHAKDVDGECWIYRFGVGQPVPPGPHNGDKVKQTASDEFGFETEECEWGRNNIVTAYKVTGFTKRNTTGTVKPPHSIKSRGLGPCEISGTFTKLELQHRYAAKHSLYEDPKFAADPENYGSFSKTNQAIERQVRERMLSSGIKPDNRLRNCIFYTTKGHAGFNGDEMTVSQPSVGIWWEYPEKITKEDHSLFCRYYDRARARGYNNTSETFTEIIIPKINKLLEEQKVRVENLDEVLDLVL